MASIARTPPVPAPGNAAGLRERARGTLLGLIVGHALGTPAEPTALSPSLAFAAEPTTSAGQVGDRGSTGRSPLVGAGNSGHSESEGHS